MIKTDIMNKLSTYLVRFGAMGIIAATALYGGNVRSQDVRFSQPFTNVLGLNPAMMGSNTDLNATLNHRNHWATLNSGYLTYNLNVLYPYFLKEGNSKLDFGLGVQNRSQGAFDFMNANLSVGYKLKLTSTGHNLSAAIQTAYYQNNLNSSDLIFDDQYSGGEYNPNNMSAENISSESIGGIDASFGLMWFYNPGPDSGKVHAFFGISVYHLNQADESFTGTGFGIPMRQSFQTGLKIYTSEKLNFSPQLMYNAQGGSEELSVGLYLDYHINEKLMATLGGWYRKDNAIALILGCKFREYSLGYSYDILSSHLGTSTSGLTTHEISLSYRLNMAARKSIDAGTNPLAFY